MQNKNKMNHSLNSSLNIWSEHINACLNVRKSQYKGHAVNGFKNGNQTKPAYDFIKAYMITNGKPDYDTDPSNVASTLFKLLEKAEASDFSS